MSARLHVALLASLALLRLHPGIGEEVRVGREALFPSEVRDIQWLGEEKQTLLLLTHGGELHRSTTAGEAWSDLTPTLQAAAGPEEQVGPVRLGRLSRSPAPNARDTVVALTNGGPAPAFVSTDAGATWAKLDGDLQLQSWVFHSTRPTWALLSFWTQACRGGGTGQCSHNLYITRDLGRTLALVASHVVQFSWGSPGTGQQDRIYFTHFRDKSVPTQPRLTRWMKGVDFALTDDFGTGVVQLVENGNKFQISHDYVLAVRCIDEASQQVELVVNSDGGLNYQVARLPTELQQRSYTLLDTSEGAVILHVNHGNTVGDVYISDGTGVSYTLSLTNNVRRRGVCAFEKVMNLNGIYIANVEAAGGEGGDEDEEEGGAEGESAQTQAEASIRWLSEQEAEPPVAEGLATLSPQQANMAAWRQSRVEASAGRWRMLAQPGDLLQGARAGGPRRRGRRRRLRRAQAAASGPQTVISFDMGGAWSYLRPPSVDSAGQPVTCPSADNCHLHLHGFTEIFEFAPVYSYRNAVGILMGSGNVGPELTFNKEQTNTYLSRDGGLSWSEVRKGTYIYEYGNHGGLLVMADMARPTTSAVYSWDEGKSWTTFNFTPEAMEVSNILIEPDAAATKFVVYGRRGRSGVLHMLDFSGLHPRVCQGSLEPDTSTSDYEQWSPADGHGTSACILGHQNIYVRRKQLSQCFNEEELERPTFRKNCPCTRESFECEVGFTRAVDSMECHYDPSASLHVPVPGECTGAATEYWDDAYRRVPGDTCEGGWQPVKAPVPCPVRAVARPMAAQSTGGGGGGRLALGLVLLGLGGTAVYQRETIRGWLQRLYEVQSARAVEGKYAQCGPPQVGAEMVGSTYSPPLHL